MTGSWKRKCRIGAGQVGGHLVEMSDVGWATAPGLALVLQLQVGGEQVQEGLKQRPDPVKDYAMKIMSWAKYQIIICNFVISGIRL